MPVMVPMPDFGTAVSGVRITKWLVAEGAAVRRGDALAEIETDKATTELEAIADGVLLRCLIREGSTAETGEAVAWIGAAGESVESIPAPRATGPRVARMVANLAATLGVDLDEVRGTGAGAAITREDVIRAAESTPARRGQSVVARTVQRSTVEIPHLRVSASIDMSEVIVTKSGNSFYDAVFIKGLALACGEVPLPGVSAEGIALAVDVEGQLWLPVIPDPGSKPLPAVQEAVSAAVERAATGKLKASELGGASIALSNLGMYAVDWFEAIVYPGHKAILALARVESRPVVRTGQVMIRAMSTVVLAADHRIINGRLAARFLTALKLAVESGRVLS